MSMDAQKVLTEELIKASNDYYNNGESGMSDHEFDEKLERLREMEKESGIVLEASPTQNVGAKVTQLKTVIHEYPALSLDKVKYKNREKLCEWLDKQDGCLSWKADGSTIVATYDNGRLTQVVTRGNGEEGSDITHNAVYFKGLPTQIPYKQHLVVRGEAMMTHAEFERINAESNRIYENARNLATATIQMLDSEESRQREIIFRAFKMVYPAADTSNAKDNPKYETERFAWLINQGFEVIPYKSVKADTILSEIDKAQEEIGSLPYPTDGLVLSYNDQVYADRLGMTGHHPHGSIAMKWTDETQETTLRSVEWSVGKTGLITPVAVFDTVRLGLGSDVSRASMHNLSIMDKLGVKIGSSVNVYLANLIIPQIENASGGTKDIRIPDVCPICGKPVTIRTDEKSGVKTLHCENTECPARIRGELENAIGKDGLYVKGLGPNQIEDLQKAGLIQTYTAQIFKLKETAEKDPDGYNRLLSMDGWGSKSWNNLINAIEEAKQTTLQKFLYSLNIPLLGKDLSRKLSKLWNGDIEKFKEFFQKVSVQTSLSENSNEYGQNYGLDYLTAVDGIGYEKAYNIVKWINDTAASGRRTAWLKELLSRLSFEAPVNAAEQTLSGKTFVITGAVHDYKNRDEFKASIEARGGKVAGSVSAKTDYLVNNDIEFASGKNKKAKELNIPIISENQFISMFGK